MIRRFFILFFLFSFTFFSCASSANVSNDASPVMFSESSEGLRSSETSIDNRMITYSVTLGLVVKDTEETKRLLLEHMKNLNGFVVRETDNSISTRIPSDNMDSFISYSKTLGNTENERRTGTDITDQYRDNVSRLDSLKNVRNRYIALLDQARSVNDILSIEKELERVNTEIDRLEGRIRHAEQSVAYSHITVGFREKTKPGPIGWIFFGLYHGIKWPFVWN